MLLAYQQNLYPFESFWLSLVVAALPVVVLFCLLVPVRMLASKAALGGAITALLVAWLIYGMPFGMAFMAFVDGAAFGLLPVGWTIFNTMLLYNATVVTGDFSIVRRSVAGLSGDARIQAILIGFAFGAFLEGAAGAGTPVAICGAILVGLGFNPFLAAVLCLVANTSPVAFGGLGTPILVLTGVTQIPGETLSVMAAHQLPLLSLIVPIYMVKLMCSWKQTFEVWPALLVAGGSFAAFQYSFATIHTWPGFHDIVLYPMTDIGGGIFALVITAIFLKFWKPKKEWHFTPQISAKGEGPGARGDGLEVSEAACDPNAEPALAAAAAALHAPDRPLGFRNVTRAWAPYLIMSILLLGTGFVRQREVPVKPGPGPVKLLPWLSSNYQIPIPLLDNAVMRDARLHDPSRGEQKPEEALFNFAWFSAPGSAVFAAAILSMFVLRMNRQQVKLVFRQTFVQMKIPIPAIACMLGLSYVTRYAGMDATLGVAFASTGVLYPFFAPLLGWLGVFLTGTDAGSNALFGSLQKITAQQVYNTGVFHHLDATQAQVLLCTSNSTGGVMGKMIDAQSICVATAATNQLGKEADIFKAVVWHSVILACVVGLITLVQAYVMPFTLLVPHP
jgi:L-lactate transport